MKTLTLVIGIVALAGCSTVERLWNSEPRERPRVPADAAEYRCEAGRTLIVRFDADRSAWLLLPDREVRLDAAGEGRWSNGRTLLSSKGEEFALQEGNAVSHSACRKM